jgi:hypothetical protein
MAILFPVVWMKNIPAVWSIKILAGPCFIESGLEKNLVLLNNT